MDDEIKRAIENLNEKLDLIFRHIENIEKKVDKIDERQSEQSRILGEYRIQIGNIEKDIVEVKNEYKSDVDLIWQEFRRREKIIIKIVGGFIITTIGFFANLIYNLMIKGGTK